MVDGVRRARPASGENYKQKIDPEIENSSILHPRVKAVIFPVSPGRSGK
jgi:hypothetical protein